MTAVGGHITEHEITKAAILSRLQIPLFSSLVEAGFGNVAENFIEEVLDLNQLCIPHPAATYFVRVQGESMLGDFIRPNDILVVDCAYDPKYLNGRIIVAWANGGLVVKRLHVVGEMIVLMSSNPDFEPIYVHENTDFKVMGLVTFVVHKLL